MQPNVGREVGAPIEPWSDSCGGIKGGEILAPVWPAIL